MRGSCLSLKRFTRIRTRWKITRPLDTGCKDEPGIGDVKSFCNPQAPNDRPYFRADERVRADFRAIRRGTFLYLVQGEGKPSKFWEDVAARTDSQLIWLSWKRPVGESERKNYVSDYLYYTNSSYSRGRNRQLWRGLELEKTQRWMFEYFIFVDEDQEFMEFTAPSAKAMTQDESSQFTTVALLNSLLSEYRPARAGIHVVREVERNKSEAFAAAQKENNCVSYVDLDGNLDAFHRSVLDLMMPYTSRYDDVVIWLTSAVMNVKSDIFLGPFSVKFQQLVSFPFAGKQKHAGYPILQFEAYRHKLYCFLNRCLSPQAERANSLYTSETDDRFVARIYALNQPDLPTCLRMSPDVDYSLIFDKTMRRKNWFLPFP